MKILYAQKLSKDFSPVFVLKEKQKPESHPLFKFLPKNDQDNLRAFAGHAHQEDKYEHVLLLSGGLRVLVFGVSGGFNHRRSIRLMRRVIAVARRERISNITLCLEDFEATDSPKGFLAEVLAIQLEIANFEFVEYKEKPKKGWFFVKEALIYADIKRPPAGRAGINADVQQALNRGKIIGEEINHTRILSNTPGGDMTPKKLAEAAMRAGKSAGFKVRVLNEQAIRKLKMGGVLGVSQGSLERPRFIIMEHTKGKKGEKPVVLVGKGVTFDTGGLNIKGDEHMYEMHMDMSGGAAVIHTIAALARLKVKKNVIGLVPAVENMPSGSSYRPGDVLKTMSGKTIEVLNTDAEGRVILADGLEYAKRYKPRLVVDVATLTGAALVALGQRASALFSTDSKISKILQDTGEAVYDLVWPLPLWEEYEEDIKGVFGDVANTSTGKNKYGGVSTSAAFLWQFTKDSSTNSSGRGSGSAGQAYPWVHLDIAPRMTTIESDYLAKGAAGAPVALLTYFLRRF